MAHGPHPHSEERHVDDGGLAGTFTVEQGAEDSPRDGHGTDGVAEPGRRRDGNEVVFGPRGPGRHARAGPEGQGVVGPLVGVRSALALTRPAHVNDAGVLGPNLVHPDLQLRPHARELVGQEDVGRPGQLVEDLQTLGRGQVETQALLPPVRVLEQHVDVVGDERQTRRGQAAHGIAPLHVLDLDDLGAPVGQQSRCRGHERVLGHLEDPDTLQYGGHASPPTIDWRRRPGVEQRPLRPATALYRIETTILIGCISR